MRKLFLLATIVAVFISCTKEREVLAPSEPTKSKMESYRMTPDEAASYAIMLLEDKNPKKTRSMSKVSVNPVLKGDVFENGIAPLSGEMMSDTMMYAVNFMDGEGFVLMSVDSRVPVLAYGEQGNFDVQTDNPGVKLFMRKSQDYIAECVTKYDSVVLAENAARSIEGGASPFIVVPPTNPSNPPYFGAVFDGYEYQMMMEVDFSLEDIGPYLKSQWHQESPFNYDVSYNCAEHPSEKYPIGCGIAAAIQIMNYHKFPKTYQGTTYDWNAINACPYGKNITMEAVRQISQLAVQATNVIESELNHKPDGSHSTGTKPSRFQFMVQLGFTADGWNQPYDVNNVRNSLRNRRPVIISAYEYQTNQKRVGHGWIIDGLEENEAWLKYKYEKWRLLDGTTYRRPAGYTVMRPRFYTNHCNWGWKRDGNGNSQNGYFNEGVWAVRGYVFDRDMTIEYGIRPK